MTESDEIKLRKVLLKNMLNEFIVDGKKVNRTDGSPLLVVEDFEQLLIDIIKFNDARKK